MLPFAHRIASETVENNPLWLVVLCDIMTNLMLFFLVLYAFTRQPDQFRLKFVEGMLTPLDKKEERAGDIVQRFQENEASRALPQLLRQAGLQGAAEVELREGQIRVRLPSPVLFRSGEADLSPQAKKALQPIGRMLAGMPNSLVVEGHTDDVRISAGPHRTNWELSVARAYAVLEHLSQAFGIPEERFIVAGYGEFKPLGSNTTPSGRARNRRIEIIIMRRGA